MKQAVTVAATLPQDHERAVLVGRVWHPGARGPSIVAVRDGQLVDITANTATMSQLCDREDPARCVRDMTGNVIGSLADILAMIAGFIVARLLPVWSTVFFAVAMEAFAAYMIRDNLVLNIVMLLYPLEAIKLWQAGG